MPIYGLPSNEGCFSLVILADQCEEYGFGDSSFCFEKEVILSNKAECCSFGERGVPRLKKFFFHSICSKCIAIAWK